MKYVNLNGLTYHYLMFSAYDTGAVRNAGCCRGCKWAAGEEERKSPSWISSWHSDAYIKRQDRETSSKATPSLDPLSIRQHFISRLVRLRQLRHSALINRLRHLWEHQLQMEFAFKCDSWAGELTDAVSPLGMCFNFNQSRQSDFDLCTEEWEPAPVLVTAQRSAEDMICLMLRRRWTSGRGKLEERGVGEYSGMSYFKIIYMSIDRWLMDTKSYL